MSKVPFVRGAALEYAQSVLGGPTVEVDSTVSVGASATIIAKGNGDRVGLIIVNLGTGSVWVAPDSGVASTKGILLSANGGSVAMTVVYDFTLTTREWYAISDGSGPYNVFVLEYSRFALNA